MAQESATFLDAASWRDTDSATVCVAMSGPAMTSRQFPEVLREQLPTDGETRKFLFWLCMRVYVHESYVDMSNEKNRPWLFRVYRGLYYSWSSGLLYPIIGIPIDKPPV